MLEFEFGLCFRTFHVRNLLLKKKKKKNEKKNFGFLVRRLFYVSVVLFHVI